MHLQPVHPEIVTASIGVGCVDERQRDERSPILVPTGQRGEPIEANLRGHTIDDGALRHPASSDLDQVQCDVARTPQRRRARRQQGFGKLDGAPHQSQRPLAEGPFRATRGAEQIRDQTEIGLGDVVEKQRRSPGGDDAAVNLRRFQMGIDLASTRDEVVVTAKLIHG